MEDQGKRLLLAVAIVFALFFVWNEVTERFFPQPKTPPTDKSTEQPEGDRGDPQTPSEPKGEPDTRKPAGPELADSTGTPDATPPSGDANGRQQDEMSGTLASTPDQPRREEQFIDLEFPDFRARFTNYGANLVSWELLGPKYREVRDGKDAPLDLVRGGKTEDVLPFAVSFANRDWWPAHSEWEGHKVSDTKVEYTWSFKSQEAGSATAVFELRKTYEVFPDDYLVELTIDVVNRRAKEENQTVVVSLHGFQDITEDTSSGWGSRVDTAWKSECVINGNVEKSTAKDLVHSSKKRFGTLHWGGFNHSYFLIAAAPKDADGSSMGCNSAGYEDRPGLMRTDIVFPEVNMRRDGPPTTYVLAVYMGPKYLDKLEAIPRKIGFDPHYGEAIDLGWFGVIARPMLWLLQWLHSFLGNWGISIIFLTILVKLATLYWNTKAIRSMRKMASLKPQMEVIQKKYKDDKARQQQELMNLYKAHGVNPVAGCLPMFLQMPIWIALYRTLGAAAELYHSPFIPGWIDNLTGTDPYYILPIALMAMMFVQAKLSPSTPDSTQQKIMMYGLPLMFGVFGFFFPSGLTLYMLTNAVLTALHNVWMNRTDPTQKKGKAVTQASDVARADTKPASKPISAKAPVTDSREDASADADAGSSGPSGESGPRNGARKQVRRRGGKRKRGGNGS